MRNKLSGDRWERAFALLGVWEAPEKKVMLSFNFTHPLQFNQPSRMSKHRGSPGFVMGNDARAWTVFDNSKRKRARLL